MKMSLQSDFVARALNALEWKMPFQWIMTVVRDFQCGYQKKSMTKSERSWKRPTKNCRKYLRGIFVWIRLWEKDDAEFVRLMVFSRGCLEAGISRRQRLNGCLSMKLHLLQQQTVVSLLIWKVRSAVFVPSCLRIIRARSGLKNYHESLCMRRRPDSIIMDVQWHVVSM